jgi:hypothetical protein
MEAEVEDPTAFRGVAEKTQAASSRFRHRDVIAAPRRLLPELLNFSELLQLLQAHRKIRGGRAISEARTSRDPTEEAQTLHK